MINYVKGDLLAVNYGIIAHGCNAQGVMGSGVAKAVRAKYPHAYEQYKTYCAGEKNKSNLLGQTAWYSETSKLFVANCITQLNFGGDGRLYLDYDALENAWYT